MDTTKIKLIAFDLDGTLTQHKTKLDEKNRKVLDELGKKYKLLMAGAGTCRRIFEQMEKYPIDIIGNYGMQYAEFDEKLCDIVIKKDVKVEVDRETIEKKITLLREKYGFTSFAGDNTEYHPSGCITFPLLGTKANLSDKLAFDPDRTKRRVFYDDVKNTFCEYTVFIGGTSSFDMAPKPYDKAFALSQYCSENGILHSEVVYVGDDYGIGGNDESVYLSDFNFVKIDDYTKLSEVLKFLL